MTNFNNDNEDFNNSSGSGEFYTNSSHYAPPQPEKPSRKPKILFLVLAIVAVLLAGSITAFACVPSISNQIYLTVLSPKDYYSKVEKKSIDAAIHSISSAYGKQIDKIKNKTTSPKTVSANVKVLLNDNFLSTLGLSELFPVELKTTVSSDPESKKEKIWGELLLSEESLGSLNLLMDLSKENLISSYLQIPEMSEYYLYMNPAETIAQIQPEMDDADDATTKAQLVKSKFLEEPTSEKLLETLLSRYGNIITENISIVELEKNSEVNANGVTVKNTKIITAITSKEMKNIIKEVANTAKNDSDLKNELLRLGVCTEEEYNTSMENAIAEAEEIDDSDEGQILMTVWIDNNGKITGREFTIESPGKNPVIVSYHSVKEKNTTNFEYSQTSDNVTSIILKGKNINEKGVFNGEITAELGGGGASNYSAVISYDNVTQTSNKTGFFNGNFNLSITQVPSVSLKLTATGTEKEQKLLFETLAFGTNAGSLEINLTEEEFQDFTFPDADKIYNIDNSEDMENYIKNANQEYIEKVKNKINEILGDGSSLPIIDDIIDGSDDTIPDNTDIPEPTNNPDSTNNNDNNTSKDFSINKNPQTKADLPDNADIDDNGYYSYEVTDEQVMANGEPSTVVPCYSSLLFTDVKKDLYKVITDATDKKWKENKTRSYNSVSGVLDNPDSFRTFFSTTTEWNNSSDSVYRYFSVDYDTYSKEISEFTISGTTKKETYKIIKKLLALTEENFSDKDFEKIKKKLNKVKKGDSDSFDFGKSYIYYSVSNDGSYYCSIEAARTN